MKTLVRMLVLGLATTLSVLGCSDPEPDAAAGSTDAVVGEAEVAEPTVAAPAAVENAENEPASGSAAVSETAETGTGEITANREEPQGEFSLNSAKTLRTKNDLKMILLAFHNYHDVNGAFPPCVIDGPDGKPWHSWRVLILPYLDESDMYDDYRVTEPWDSPHNLAVTQQAPSGLVDEMFEDQESGVTNYAMLLGPNSLFANRVRFDGTHEGFEKALREGVGIRQITDGTSTTAIVGTVAPSNNIRWSEPRDVMTAELDEIIGSDDGLSDAHGKVIVGFCDGSVRALEVTERREIDNLIDPTDGL